jgi:hypothetical protein
VIDFEGQGWFRVLRAAPPSLVVVQVVGVSLVPVGAARPAADKNEARDDNVNR